MKTQIPAPRELQNSGSPATKSLINDQRPQTQLQRTQQQTMANSAQNLQLQAMQRKMQVHSESTQLHSEETPLVSTESAQRQEAAPKPNNTGLPDQLKSGIESLSGMSMDHVKVHYNSSQPAQLNAHAYAQGSEIHVAPGQEQHLPHEAWHVVQQAQGRVKPTMQMKQGVPVNDDEGLEHEADVMGAKALNTPLQRKIFDTTSMPTGIGVAQKTPAQQAEVTALGTDHPDMPPTYLNTVAEVKDTDDVAQHNLRWGNMHELSNHTPSKPIAIANQDQRFKDAKKAVVDNIPTVRTSVKTTYLGVKEPLIAPEIEAAKRRDQEAQTIVNNLPVPGGSKSVRKKMKEDNIEAKSKKGIIHGTIKDIEERAARFPAVKLLPKLIRAAGYIPPIINTNKTAFSELIDLDVASATARGGVLSDAKEEYTDENIGKLNWLQWFALNTPTPYITNIKLPLTHQEIAIDAYTREYELNGQGTKVVHIHWDNSGDDPVVANGASPAHTKMSRWGSAIETLPKARLKGLHIPVVGDEKLP